MILIYFVIVVPVCSTGFFNFICTFVCDLRVESSQAQTSDTSSQSPDPAPCNRAESAWNLMIRVEFNTNSSWLGSKPCLPPMKFELFRGSELPSQNIFCVGRLTRQCIGRNLRHDSEPNRIDFDLNSTWFARIYTDLIRTSRIHCRFDQFELYLSSYDLNSTRNRYIVYRIWVKFNSIRGNSISHLNARRMPFKTRFVREIFSYLFQTAWSDARAGLRNFSLETWWTWLKNLNCYGTAK
jgi:hypothetical protein